MRVLALILILLGGAALLVPQFREYVPYVRLNDAAVQWIGFGSLAMATLVYFLAPRD